MQRPKVLDQPRELPFIPDNSLEIAAMTLFQLGEVMILERLCFPTPWPPSTLAQEILRPESLPLVLEKNESGKKLLIGFSLCRTHNVNFHITNFGIHPDYRRRGHGEAFLRAIIDFARTKNFRSIVLQVRVSNSKAISLYQKLGFNIVETLPEYYVDSKEDAFLLTRILDKHAS